MLSGSEGVAGDADVMGALAGARARLDALKGVDERLDEAAARLERAFFELEDLGRDCRDYNEGLASDPALLEEVEQRLDLLSQLKRKYGTSIREVINYAEEAGVRLQALESSEADSRSLDAELEQNEAELLELARSLRKLREKAAPGLAAEVESHLRDLAFSDCSFEVRLRPREGDGGLGAGALSRSGADDIEFYVRLNPGMPATPIRETASGGELSRIMLSVKCAVASPGEAATLVFDEIDAGIGGETGSAVGAKLKRLARGSQVICITHLPQIASYADAHFSVTKTVDDSAGETVTAVRRLEGGEVVDELCRMMGSRPGDGKARAHAENLIRKAAAV